MTLEATAATVRTYARNRKARLGDDTFPFLLVVRDERPTAVASSDDMNALSGLAQTAAAGYGAEALALVIEIVVPLVDENPETGRAWARGEAQELWRRGDGVERGWVSEAQLTGIALRDGACIDEAYSFRMRDRSIEWGDQPLAIGGSWITEALSTRFGRPALNPARVPDPGDGFEGDPVNGPFYDVARGRVSLDVGCTRALGRQLGDRGEVCLIAQSRAQAESLIAEGVPDWQVELV